MVIDARPSRRGKARTAALRFNWIVPMVAAAAAQAIAPAAFAQLRAPYRATASLGVDESYSDNIDLVGAGQKRSEFVTTISPSFQLSGSGSKLSLSLAYAPQLLLYARGTNGTQLRNSFNATVRATLIEKLLTFDANSTVGQTNISPFGAQVANSFNGSSNRAETRTYSLGPTLQSRIGRDLSYSAGYHYSVSSSNSDALATSHTTQAFAQFTSGTSFKDIGYGADISRNEQEYGGLNRIVTETAGGTLTYVVSPTIHLHSRIGYDRDSYPTAGQPDLKSVTYSGGFNWDPSHHTSINVEGGHRYFGPTANISLRETGPRFAVTASYSRNQSTSTGNGQALVADPNYTLIDQYYRTTITDPLLRAQAVTAALTQLGLSTSPYAAGSFLSNQIYVQKSAQISLALLGLKNTVTFDASHGDSQSLSAIDTGFDVFDQSQRFRTTSLSANWSYKLGPRTSLNATVTKTHNLAVNGVGDSRTRQLIASVNRQIGKTLTGTLLYRNSRQDSDNGNGNGSGPNSNFYTGSYRENAVIGSLRLTF